MPEQQLLTERRPPRDDEQDDFDPEEEEEEVVDEGPAVALNRNQLTTIENAFVQIRNHLGEMEGDNSALEDVVNEAEIIVSAAVDMLEESENPTDSFE